MPQHPPPIAIGESLKKQSRAPYIHKISQGELVQFIRHAEQARKGNKTPISFVNFIKGTILQNQHPNVIPDFSQMPIITPEPQDITLDLSDVDFTGCSINDSTFRHCNLSRSIFCDLDLKNVTFEQCVMQDTDLRGAVLSTCNIAPLEASGHEEAADLENYRGLKLGASINTMQNHQDSSILQGYKGLADLEKTLQDTSNGIRDLEKFIKEDKKANSQSVMQRTFNYITNNTPEGIKEHQDEVRTFEERLAEQKRIESSLKEQLDSDKKALKSVPKLPFHPSIIKIATTPAPTQASTQSFEDFEKESLIPEIGNLVTLDPTYVKNSTAVERNQKKEYFPATRADLEVYKDSKLKNPNLSFNEFIRGFASAEHIQKDAQIITDFSGQDLSDFDFNDLDLRGVCFAGATLNNAKFNGANLSGVNFEGANLTGAEFKNTTARDVNMRSATLDNVKIEESDFVRADMSYSTSSKIEIENANLNFSTINNSDWQDAVIANSAVNYADFEESTLQGTVKNSYMQYSNFNSATIQLCNIINSDLSLSTMIGANAQNSHFLKESVLYGIDAKEAHLENSEIDRSCNAKKLNLNGGFIDEMTAKEVDFTGSTLQKVQAKKVDFEGATLTNVHMQLSDLEGANLDYTKANGLDLTASYVAKMHANNASLKRATLAGISVYREIYDYHKNLHELAAEAHDPPSIKTQNGQIQVVDGKLELSRTDLTQADLTSATIPETNLDSSRLVSATLKGATLRSSTLHRANINNATTETSTDLHGCTAESTLGKLKHTNDNKLTQKIPIREKITQDNENQEANQEQNFLDRLLSNASNLLNTSGHFIEALGDSMGYKISPQWGRAVGATAGALIALGLIGGTGGIAAVPFGLGLVAVAGIGAVGGGLIGDQAVKRIGAFSLGIGSITTAFYGTTIGGVAFTAATSAEQGVRTITGGLGIGGIIGRWTSQAGRRIRRLGTPTQAQQELLNVTDARERETRTHNRNLATALQEIGETEQINKTQANKLYKNQLSHSKLAEIKTPTKYLQDTKSIGYRIRKNILGEPSVEKSNRAPQPTAISKSKRQRQRQRQQQQISQ